LVRAVLALGAAREPVEVLGVLDRLGEIEDGDVFARRGRSLSCGGGKDEGSENAKASTEAAIIHH
jgi:hypothetical protein